MKLENCFSKHIELLFPSYLNRQEGLLLVSQDFFPNWLVLFLEVETTSHLWERGTCAGDLLLLFHNPFDVLA